MRRATVGAAAPDNRQLIERLAVCCKCRESAAKLSLRLRNYYPALQHPDRCAARTEAPRRVPTHDRPEHFSLISLFFAA
jgi:hypothetical protein